MTSGSLVAVSILNGTSNDAALKISVVAEAVGMGTLTISATTMFGFRAAAKLAILCIGLFTLAVIFSYDVVMVSDSSIITGVVASLCTVATIIGVGVNILEVPMHEAVGSNCRFSAIPMKISA